MRHVATAMWVVLCFTWIVPTQAHADKPWERGVSNADQDIARRLTSEGVRAAADSRWPIAASKFLEALKHWDHPRIHYNLIEPLVMLDRPLDAYRHIAKALAHGREGLGPEKYREALVQQKQLAGRIAVVTISCDVPGAAVALDGEPLFTAPGKRKLTLVPGTHVVVATKEGYFQATRSIVVIGGKTTATRIELVKLSAGKTIYQRRFRSWLPWSVVGAGALVGFAGLGFRTLAGSNFDQYDSRILSECNPSCTLDEAAEHGQLKDRGELYNAAAATSLVVAGGLLVTGFTLVFLNRSRAVGVERPKGPANGPDVTPVVGRSRAGALVSWLF